MNNKTNNQKTTTMSYESTFNTMKEKAESAQPLGSVLNLNFVKTESL